MIRKTLSLSLVFAMMVTFATTCFAATGAAYIPQAAVAASYGDLIEAVARMPETKEDLLALKEELSPAISNLDSEEVQIARAEALGQLYRSVARQPDLKDELVSLFTDLLGEKPENASPAVEAAAVRSYGILIEAISRVPEMKEDLLALKEELSPTISNLNSEEVQIARAETLGELYRNVARQPDLKDDLVSLFTDLLGAKPESTSPAVEAAAVKSYSSLIEAVTRMPEMKEELLALKEELSPAISNLNSEEVQVARTETLVQLYGDVARQHYLKDDLVSLFTDLLGAKPENASPAVEAAVARSYGGLIQAISRWPDEPEMKEELLALKEELSPAISNLDSGEVQAARVEVLGQLYSTFVKWPEFKDEFVALFTDLLGAKTENPTLAVEAAAVKSYGDLITTVATYPDMKEELLALKEELSPAVSNLNSEEAQAARAEALGQLYSIFVRDPDRKDELVTLFTDLLGGKQDINYYTVSFDSNGGTSVNCVVAFSNSTIAQPEAPTKADYNFVGWYNGEEKFDFNTPITQDITLTAKWSKKIIYPITGDTNQTITAGNENDISFKVETDFSEFKQLYCNGVLVDPKNYTLKDDYNLICLTSDFVKSLPAGTYTFKIEFTDGYAMANVTVVNSTTNSGDEPLSPDPEDESSSPTTGDNESMIWPMWGLLIGSCCAVGILLKKDVKKSKENFVLF